MSVKKALNEEAREILYNGTPAEWADYCRTESDKKIWEAALKYLVLEVPETAELSTESRDALVDMLLSFDTEGYFYQESTQ